MAGRESDRKTKFKEHQTSCHRPIVLCDKLRHMYLKKKVISSQTSKQDSDGKAMVCPEKHIGV